MPLVATVTLLMSVETNSTILLNAMTLYMTPGKLWHLWPFLAVWEVRLVARANSVVLHVRMFIYAIIL